MATKVNNAIQQAAPAPTDGARQASKSPRRPANLSQSTVQRSKTRVLDSAGIVGGNGLQRSSTSFMNQSQLPPTGKKLDEQLPRIEHSVDKPNKFPVGKPAAGADISKSLTVLHDKTDEQLDQVKPLNRARTDSSSPMRRERRSDYPTSPTRARDLVVEALRRKEEEEERKKSIVKPTLTPAQQAEQEKKELLGDLSMTDMNEAQKDIVEQQKRDCLELKQKIEDQQKVNDSVQDEISRIQTAMTALLVALFIGVLINYQGGVNHIIDKILKQ